MADFETEVIGKVFDDGFRSPPRKEQSASEKKSKAIYLQRICTAEFFAEAVLVAGLPKFLLANDGTGEVSIADFIPLGKEGKIAYPLAAESYINKPYTFNSQLELDATIEEAKRQTLDTLYRTVKGSWKMYIDADDFHIS